MPFYRELLERFGAGAAHGRRSRAQEPRLRTRRGRRGVGEHPRTRPGRSRTRSSARPGRRCWCRCRTARRCPARHRCGRPPSEAGPVRSGVTRSDRRVTAMPGTPSWSAVRGLSASRPLAWTAFMAVRARACRPASSTFARSASSGGTAGRSTISSKPRPWPPCGPSSGLLARGSSCSTVPSMNQDRSSLTAPPRWNPLAWHRLTADLPVWARRTPKPERSPQQAFAAQQRADALSASSALDTTHLTVQEAARKVLGRTA